MDEAEEVGTIGADPVTPTELRVRRHSLGLSQAALARALGVASNTVARWERGERPIRSPELVALALQRLDGMPDEPAAGKRAHNLPAELSSFVGREHELAALTTLLGNERLLTLGVKPTSVPD